MVTATVETLERAYLSTRGQTMKMVAPLETEDYVVQTAPFMSPPRWHMGHTSWFFEMLLKEYLPGYRLQSEEYCYYFNSYYDRFGTRIAKDRRGTRSRPTVEETVRYRNAVDEGMRKLFDMADTVPGADRLAQLVRLGIEHEMQHQELLVYDIKHLLCDLYDVAPPAALPEPAEVGGEVEISGGLFRMGHRGDGFAFDNEKPSHQVYVQDFAMDRAPVSNGEYLRFVESGGYNDYRWWFSEGWKAVHDEQWEAPLYWELQDGRWLIRDFHGLHRVKDKANEPVSHVSFYEASAYAKWAGKRLPTEAEWERAACHDPASGESRPFPWGSMAPGAGRANLLEDNRWGVAPIGSCPEGQTPYGCHQMIGDVWEWTTSDYVPYPGFAPDFDEYNDKWMVGQKVLRGGSFATPRSHIRTTYRNFFHPNERWMVAGFRCARTF